jgi:hypothetical protein
VVSQPSPKGLTFDLRDTRNYPLARNARNGRWLFLGLFVFVAGGFLYAVVSFAAKGAWTATNLTFLALGIWICGMFAYIAVGYTPQAEYLELNERGMQLRYASGRIQTILWADPKLKLKLERNELSGRAARPMPSMWVLLGNRPSQNYLTQEAFDELIRQARGRGLTVGIRPARRPGWTRFNITPKSVTGFG